MYFYLELLFIPFDESNILLFCSYYVFSLNIKFTFLSLSLHVLWVLNGIYFNKNEEFASISWTYRWEIDSFNFLEAVKYDVIEEVIGTLIAGI